MLKGEGFRRVRGSAYTRPTDAYLLSGGFSWKAAQAFCASRELQRPGRAAGGVGADGTALGGVAGRERVQRLDVVALVVDVLLFSALRSRLPRRPRSHHPPKENDDVGHCNARSGPPLENC